MGWIGCYMHWETSFQLYSRQINEQPQYNMCQQLQFSVNCHEYLKCILAGAFLCRRPNRLITSGEFNLLTYKSRRKLNLRSHCFPYSSSHIQQIQCMMNIASSYHHSIIIEQEEAQMNQEISNSKGHNTNLTLYTLSCAQLQLTHWVCTKHVSSTCASNHK